MKTASFLRWRHNSETIPGVISISRHPPLDFDGPECPLLMPSVQILQQPPADREALYLLQLSCLSPRDLWQYLHALVPGHEPVLLGMASSLAIQAGCIHRQLVADWFERELGEKVDEWRAGGC